MTCFTLASLAHTDIDNQHALMRLSASATAWCIPKPKIWSGSLGVSCAIPPRPTGTFRCQSSSTSVATSSDTPVKVRNTLFSLTKTEDGRQIKPFYITTPIFYVNACTSTSAHRGPYLGTSHPLILLQHRMLAIYTLSCSAM